MLLGEKLSEVETGKTGERRFQFSFAGGGANFLAHLEVISELQKRFADRINVTRVSGTSAGAIAAATLALDLDAEVIKQCLRNRREEFDELFSPLNNLNYFQKQAKPIRSVFCILVNVAILLFIIGLALKCWIWTAIPWVASTTTPVIQNALASWESEAWVSALLRGELGGYPYIELSIYGAFFLVTAAFLWALLRYARYQYQASLLRILKLSDHDRATNSAPVWRFLFPLASYAPLVTFFSQLSTERFGGEIKKLISSVIIEAREITLKDRVGSRSRGPSPFNCRDLLILATDLNSGIAKEHEFDAKQLQLIMNDGRQTQINDLVELLVVSSGIPFVFRSLQQAFQNNPEFGREKSEKPGFFVDGGFAENLPADSLINRHIVEKGDDAKDYGGIILIELTPRFSRLNEKSDHPDYHFLLNGLLWNSLSAMLNSLFRAQTALIDHLAHVSGTIPIQKEFLVHPLNFGEAYRKFLLEDTAPLKSQIRYHLERICSLNRKPTDSLLKDIHEIDPKGFDYGWRDALFERNRYAGTTGDVRLQDARSLAWMAKIKKTYLEIAKTQKRSIKLRSIRVEFTSDQKAEIFTKTQLQLEPDSGPSIVNAVEVGVAHDYFPCTTVNCQVGLTNEQLDYAPSIFFPSDAANIEVDQKADVAGIIKGVLVNFGAGIEAQTKVLNSITRQIVNLRDRSIPTATKRKRPFFELLLHNEYDTRSCDDDCLVEETYLALVRPHDVHDRFWRIEPQTEEFEFEYVGQEELLGNKLGFGGENARSRERLDVYRLTKGRFKSKVAFRVAVYQPDPAS